MAPCIEIVKYSANANYKAEGTKSVQGLIDILKASNGSHATYMGTEVQDPGFWYLFNVWDTLKHHQDLINNKQVYPKVVESAMRGCDAVQFLYHVQFQPNDPYSAFGAPVTELSLWTLKEGTNKEGFGQKLEFLTSKASEREGGFKAAWGPVMEDDRKLAALFGWHNLEEFQAAAGNAAVQEFLGELLTQADLDLKHVVLKQH